MPFSLELKAQFIKMLNEKKINYGQGWSNYMGTVTNPATLVVEIVTPQQLQEVLRLIKTMNFAKTPEDKITLRATAGWNDFKETCCCSFWSTAQKQKYNEGYSFSQVVGGRASPNTPGTDVIIRFGEKFHAMKVLGPAKPAPTINPKNPIQQLPASLVEVSAGVQIAELSDFLRKNNLSLSTASMIAWVSAVGLSGTAGHGTGRDEPAFSGLIESVKICDINGTIRDIDKEHPDFCTLMGGHSGLLGIILSMQLRVVKAFNLRETIDLFHNSKDMTGRLGNILAENQYVSIMGIPSYACPESDKLVPKWQIRHWNHSLEKPLKINKAPYAPSIKSFTQELETNLGSSSMEFLLDAGLKHLLPYFMLLSAAVITEARGTQPIIDFENNITHPQVAFPKLMRDVSYLIPVKDEHAGPMLEMLLQKMDDLLNAAAAKGEYPVTYAIYVRYFKGTNGGLSTSATSAEDERIFAIDVVTHPDAPGISHFEQQFLAFLKEHRITPRNHLGKNFPSGVVRYDQFLDAHAIADFKSALERWHRTSDTEDDGAEQLMMSPLYTPYLQQMLTHQIAFAHQIRPEDEVEELLIDEERASKHSTEECTQFLDKLHATVSLMPVTSEAGIAAKTAFLKACEQDLSAKRELSKKPAFA
jgi:L-gulonolactone oxidase